MTHETKGETMTTKTISDYIRERGLGCEDAARMSHSEQSDWAALVETMDDDLREQVHSELAPCSVPAIAERYAELHLERHGVKWPEPGMPAIPGTL
jgi:hypothetical protein